MPQVVYCGFVPRGLLSVFHSLLPILCLTTGEGEEFRLGDVLELRFKLGEVMLPGDPMNGEPNDETPLSLFQWLGGVRGTI